MSDLTNKQQQQELETYKNAKDKASFKLVELKDYFLDRCLEELKNSEKVRKTFNKLDCLSSSFTENQICCSKELTFFDYNLLPNLSDEFYLSDCYSSFQDLSKSQKTLIIQTLLSRTPDGEAVMPFLDVETKDYLFYKNLSKTFLESKKNLSIKLETIEEYSDYYYNTKLQIENVKGRYFLTMNDLENTPKTLLERMSRGFWRALSMKGKTDDEALETITKIFIDHTL